LDCRGEFACLQIEPIMASRSPSGLALCERANRADSLLGRAPHATSRVILWIELGRKSARSAAAHFCCQPYISLNIKNITSNLSSLGERAACPNLPCLKMC
jgi:hypothetical protein